MARTVSFGRDVASLLHSSIALMSLALLTLAYCAPRAFDREHKAVLFSGSQKSIERIAYDDGAQSIELLLVKGQIKEVRIAPVGAQKDPHSLVQRFKPSTGASNFLQQFAPFEAVRALGQQDEEHLQSFGLAALGSGRLGIDAGAIHVTLTLGRSLFGTSDIYAKLGQNQVFVISPLLLQPFDHSAQAIIDRHIAPPEITGAKHMVLQHGSVTRTLKLFDHDTKGFWAQAAEHHPRDGAALTKEVDQLLQELANTTFVTQTSADSMATASFGHDAITLTLGRTEDDPQPLLRMTLYDGDPAVALSSHALEPVRLLPGSGAALFDLMRGLCGG